MRKKREKAKTIHRNKQAGFSLLEVMASLSIFLVLFLGTSTAIIGSTYLSSFTKHKVQAMYWAQRYIEEQRRLPFASLVTLPSASASIDTKSTFTASADDFKGNRVVTIIPYANDANRKRIQIEMNWAEKIMGGQITLREYYSTDIANESQLN